MANERVEIRPFRTDDLGALQHIREMAFRPIFQSFRDTVGPTIARIAFAQAEKEQAQLLDEICQPDSPQQVFVALRASRIIGFVSLSLDHDQKIGEIGLNAVHPEFAGQGVGTQLYDFALCRMKSADMKVAVVGTGGDPGHAAARRAYAKAGFGPAIPSLWMYRSL
ncbi:MAG: GNAT family N-acetyltransferase [Hyphomicrobiales bacterium]|nr:GNAT family N-acetyltransferase [Hyphomicrobiales bacterium]